MLSVLLALGLFSFPTASCVSAFGTTACGYDCLAAHGQVECAQTPAGACKAGYGQVRCFDPARWVFEAFRSVPKAECIAGYGAVACGYDCVEGYGQVECARTPAGACEKGYGQVHCFDPSPRVFRRFWRRVPKAECIAGYNAIACGYDCVSAYGVVRCAQTPAGVCHAQYGQVQCFDPRV